MNAMYGNDGLQQWCTCVAVFVVIVKWPVVVMVSRIVLPAATAAAAAALLLLAFSTMAWFVQGWQIFPSFPKNRLSERGFPHLLQTRVGTPDSTSSLINASLLALCPFQPVLRTAETMLCHIVGCKCDNCNITTTAGAWLCLVHCMWLPSLDTPDISTGIQQLSKTHNTGYQVCCNACRWGCCCRKTIAS